MPTNPPIPTLEDIERILSTKDLVVRNLQITQCYHELSAVLANRTGLAANWCTFATWASKQAGQTIRKEDLARLMEQWIRQALSTGQTSEGLGSAVNLQARNQFSDSQNLSLRTQNFSAAVDRASDAVSRGNKKVFEEIGYEFARFYQTCLIDEPLDQQKITSFCNGFRFGDPPDGQNYLRMAFSHYAEALTVNDVKIKAELILLANIEIGFHEQTRLQPEIAESLDAGLISFLDFTRPLFSTIFPRSSWFHLAHLYLMRLLGRPTALDLVIQALLDEARILLRHLITENMMAICLPSGLVLRLGQDLTEAFPESLKQITNLEVENFLKKYDISPDSLGESGALDWADLPDRLHFILDLFRCYQEHQNLFEPPFDQEQVAALKDGRLPKGKL